MKKYGEIARFKINELKYIIESKKREALSLYDELYIPVIMIYITIKTAKRKRGKNLNKYDLAFSLLNNNNLKTITRIIEFIKEYLNVIKPKYIGFYPYEDNFNHRLRFFEKVLNKFHYYFLKKDDNLYYYERKD